MKIIFVVTDPRSLHQVLRNHPRAALRALHQHLPDAGPAARHRHDAEARLRRDHLRDSAVLQAEQLGPVPGDHDDGAAQVGALPGGPLPGHAGGHRGDGGGRVGRGEGRGADPDLAQGRVQAARVQGRHLGHKAQQPAGQDAPQGGQVAHQPAAGRCTRTCEYSAKRVVGSTKIVLFTN